MVAHLRDTFFFEMASNPIHSTLAFSHAVCEINQQKSYVSNIVRLLEMRNNAYNDMTHTCRKFTITLHDHHQKNRSSANRPNLIYPLSTIFTLLFLDRHRVQALIALATLCSNGFPVPDGLAGPLCLSEGIFMLEFLKSRVRIFLERM